MNASPVIIVGAGPAGIGVAVKLIDAGVSDIVLLEQDTIGASFRRWPKETRFITPSFSARDYGVRDLNSISDAMDPSRRWSEHPTGEEYAEYLEEVVLLHRVPVLTGISVRRVTRLADGCFYLETNRDAWRCAILIWAAGEFHYPNIPSFPGAELGVFSLSHSSYDELGGNEYVVIGGFESGMDVACNRVEAGARVTVVDPHPWWQVESLDPSCELAPVTRSRLQVALSTGRLRCVEGRVVRIRRAQGGYATDLDGGSTLETATAPVIATGFRGGFGAIEELIECDPTGAPVLNDDDESRRADGLYVTGPMVHRGTEKLCFIYKFRTRHSLIAEAVAAKLQGVLSHVRLLV